MTGETQDPLVAVLPEPPRSGGGVPGATGDLVIDAALRDLAAVDPDDLDGHIETAESLQRTLQARLAHLGE